MWGIVGSIKHIKINFICSFFTLLTWLLENFPLHLWFIETVVQGPKRMWPYNQPFSTLRLALVIEFTSSTSQTRNQAHRFPGAACLGNGSNASALPRGITPKQAHLQKRSSEALRGHSSLFWQLWRGQDQPEQLPRRCSVCGSFSKTKMKLLFIISPYLAEWTFAKYLIEYPRSYSRLETKRLAANDIPNIYRVPTLCQARVSSSPAS